MSDRVDLKRSLAALGMSAVRPLGMTVALLCLGAGPVNGQATVSATIRPGMTEAEVRTAFGQPLTFRKLGNMTYLYYKNDCFRRCGTYDVVFLEGGQVIDAVLRDSHRKYDGVSSSPVDRKPAATIRP